MAEVMKFDDFKELGTEPAVKVKLALVYCAFSVLVFVSGLWSPVGRLCLFYFQFVFQVQSSSVLPPLPFSRSFPQPPSSP